MMDIKNQLIAALTVFGLDQKEIAVYLKLHEQPWQTVVTLAQTIAIPRPTLYRVLATLEKKGLVENYVDHKTTYYAVTPVESFQNQIIASKQTTHHLESAFGELQSFLHTSQPPPLQTSVSFFRGKQGLQSLEWQIVEDSREETLVFGNNVWWRYLGQDFAEEIRRERLNRKLKIREILNPEHETEIGKKWTEITDYLKLHTARYISRTLLPIDNEMMITDHSVFIYSLTETELVGIKLNSPAYTKTMRALFEIVWELAGK